MKNTPTPPIKFGKLIYVPKNKGESSSKENADLKSISVHSNFFALIKEPFATDDYLEFLPKSLIITKNKETPMGYKCSIEEFPIKDDNT